MKSYYSSSRTKRQRAKKRTKAYQNFLDYYTSGTDASSPTQTVWTHYAYTSRAPAPRPALPQDGFWLAGSDTAAKDFKKVSEKIQRKEKAEEYTNRPPSRRGIGIIF